MLVRRCPQHAQALLDELAARMQANSVAVSPMAYLRGLVTRALAGTFVPEAGLRIAAVRRAREEDARHRQREPAVAHGGKPDRARTDAHRAALREALRAAQARGRKP